MLDNVIGFHVKSEPFISHGRTEDEVEDVSRDKRDRPPYISEGRKSYPSKRVQNRWPW